MKIKQVSKFSLVAAIVAGAFASGCSAMSTNDNPISTDQMAQIRAKEASQRGKNFNPAAQPGGQAAQNAGTGATTTGS